MRDDLERVRHMLEAIERIERYAVRGEAARAISKGFRERHPDVPWKQIIGMRHVIVHDYFDVDLNVVWNVVRNELPSLKLHLGKILD